jgi:MoxR-like ATPase
MENSIVPDSPESTLNPDVIEAAVRTIDGLRANMLKVFQGPHRVVELLSTCVVAGGHVLLEGVPGVAKTTLADTLARSIEGHFRRIQFTPDVLPGDITGSNVLNMRTSEFEFRPGPVFAHVVMGDEINRAPAKTQSALLEAMQEGSVTVEGDTYALPDPFIVIATQNPVEHEGVYPLPEAQLDRFMMKVVIEYPSLEQEIRMLSLKTRTLPSIVPVVNAEQLVKLRAIATRVTVSPIIQKYIAELVRATRRHSSVRLGASPRASVALMAASRACALSRSRDYVHVDDVRDVVTPVLAHRLIMHPGAEMSGVSSSDVVERVVRDVRYDRA